MRVFRSVDHHAADPEDLPDGYGHRCDVCRAEQTVFRVRGWYPPEGPGIAPDIETHYFRADHEAAATARRAEMTGRSP